MMSFSVLLLSIALASATPANPAAPPAPVTGAGSTSAQTAPDDGKLICKREKATGSKLGKRVCRTAAQIEAEREAARANLDNSSRCMRAECAGG